MKIEHPPNRALEAQCICYHAGDLSRICFCITKIVPKENGYEKTIMVKG